MKKKKDEDPIILGQEYAKARQAEERWKANKKGGTSPMPKDDYSSIKHGYSLIDPAVTPLDQEMREICKAFVGADEAQRRSITDSLSMDEFYTLLTFGERAAVFAIRQGDAGWVEAGLAACAMIDLKRIDFRDMHLSAPLLLHAGYRLNVNIEQLFRQAAVLAAPDVSEILTKYAERAGEYARRMNQGWGHVEIDTENGTGFIWSTTDKYAPTFDLKKISLELFELIERDEDYTASGITVSGFPRVWLRTKENEAILDEIETSMRGCILADGILDPQKHPDKREQKLMIFTAELENVEQAGLLLQFSRDKKSESYVMQGIQAANLFCLVVGRSVMQGVKNFETQESIKRFSGEISRILAKYIGV